VDRERGLGNLNASVNDLYGRDIVTGQLAGAVGTKLDRVDEAGIQALASQEPAERRRLATAAETVRALRANPHGRHRRNSSSTPMSHEVTAA
jgi:hypothetical protein